MNFKFNVESERNVAAAFFAVNNVYFCIVCNVVHQSVKCFSFFLHCQHKFVVDVQFGCFAYSQVWRSKQQAVVRGICLHRVVGVKFRLLGYNLFPLCKFKGEICKFFIWNYYIRLENKLDFRIFRKCDNVTVGSDEITAVDSVTYVFVAVFCHSPRLNFGSQLKRTVNERRVGEGVNVGYVTVFRII